MKSNNEIEAIEKSERSFLEEIKQLVYAAKNKAYTAINFAQVEANWLLGKKIVEQEQNGKQRAEYGKRVLTIASDELTIEFKKGFSVTNLKNFRKFYLLFSGSEKGQAMPDQSEAKLNELAILSWTHYERLIRIENKKERDWYLKEAVNQMWSYRTLDRNISTQYYHRLLASQIKQPVEDEMLEKTKEFQHDKFEFIKNPTVLEFLNLPANASYTENDLENAIINYLQQFILELGKGFAFVARQQLIRTETKDYYIDLVFYNYILKCFVLIDLKTDRITHQDVGQMDMYVRMYDEIKKQNEDNPSIGIVLCSETDHDIARYSILKGNEQLFATKYMLYLPTEEELRAEIEREKLLLKFQFGK